MAGELHRTEGQRRPGPISSATRNDGAGILALGAFVPPLGSPVSPSVFTGIISEMAGFGVWSVAWQ